MHRAAPPLWPSPLFEEFHAVCDLLCLSFGNKKKRRTSASISVYLFLRPCGVSGEKKKKDLWRSARRFKGFIVGTDSAVYRFLHARTHVGTYTYLHDIYNACWTKYNGFFFPRKSNLVTIKKHVPLNIIVYRFHKKILRIDVYNVYKPTVL